MDIMETIPHWNTKIINVERDKEGKISSIKLRIPAANEEEIKEWIHEYEEISLCNYSVQAKGKCTGMRVQFKKYLKCQHSTRCSRTYNEHTRSRTRNTNCPSKMIVTLYTIKEKYQKKDIPDRDMPCEITLMPQHNHTTNTVEALRFRRVSKETEEKLMKLYNLGHNAKTALELLKAEIIMNNEDYEVAFADRRYCPSYNHCYYVYAKYLEKKNNPVDKFKSTLLDLIKEYNEKTKMNSLQIQFVEDDYVVCLCPPLFRKVHENIRQSSEIILMDNLQATGRDKSVIFVLFTYTYCGELPLAVIITPKRDASLLIKGFHMLKDMLGTVLFGGLTDKSRVFLTSTSVEEQVAVQTVFSDAKNFINPSHLLYEVWRWLRAPPNRIHIADQPEFYGDFRAVLRATSLKECEVKFCSAVKNAVPYPNYQRYLRNFWNCKEKWVWIYLQTVLEKPLFLNGFSKTMIAYLNATLFENEKVHTLNRLIRLLSEKLVYYYYNKVKEVAESNVNASTILFNSVDGPPVLSNTDKIDVMQGVCFIPSNQPDVSYMFDVEAFMCTCRTAVVAKKACEHLAWAYYTEVSKQYSCFLEEPNIQNNFRVIINQLEDQTETSECFQDVKTVVQLLDAGPTEVVPYSEEVAQVSQDVLASSSNEEPNLEDLEKGKELIDEISNIQFKLLQQSPAEVFDLLKEMQKRYQKCKNAKTFASLVNYGLRHKPKKTHMNMVKINKQSPLRQTRKKQNESDGMETEIHEECGSGSSYYF